MNCCHRIIKYDTVSNGNMKVYIRKIKSKRENQKTSVDRKGKRREIYTQQNRKLHTKKQHTIIRVLILDKWWPYPFAEWNSIWSTVIYKCAIYSRPSTTFIRIFFPLFPSRFRLGLRCSSISVWCETNCRFLFRSLVFYMLTHAYHAYTPSITMYRPFGSLGMERIKFK